MVRANENGEHRFLVPDLFLSCPGRLMIEPMTCQLIVFFYFTCSHAETWTDVFLIMQETHYKQVEAILGFLAYSASSLYK